MRKCQYSSLASQQRHSLDSAEPLLLRTLTDPHEHNTRHHQRASDRDQKPRPSGIEDGSNEDAAQEGQEDVRAENPSY
jgi:hypothetical protein